jgi:hypothetical protein
MGEACGKHYLVLSITPNETYFILFYVTGRDDIIKNNLKKRECKLN